MSDELQTGSEAAVEPQLEADAAGQTASTVVAAQPDDIPVHSQVTEQIQEVPCKCLSAECQTALRSNLVFYQTAQNQPCPFCESSENVIRAQIIHLVQIAGKGEIVPSSYSGESPSKRFAFLCGAGKAYEQAADGAPKSFTRSPEAATCLTCLTNYGASLSGERTIELPTEEDFLNLLN